VGVSASSLWACPRASSMWACPRAHRPRVPFVVCQELVPLCEQLVGLSASTSASGRFARKSGQRRCSRVLCEGRDSVLDVWAMGVTLWGTANGTLDLHMGIFE